MLAGIDRRGLEDTLDGVNAHGGQARISETDVGDRNAVEALAALAALADAMHGRLDVWVNAAGVLVHRPMLEVEPADLERQLGVNLTGVYWCCVAAARQMRPQGRGPIVNISSTGADFPSPGLSLHSISRAGVNMLTRAAATEFGAFGVRVNAVAPGFVDTPMVAFRFRDATGGVDQEAREALLRDRAAAPRRSA